MLIVDVQVAQYLLCFLLLIVLHVVPNSNKTKQAFWLTISNLFEF